ncbi:two pore domain potassium channel family protein [bacterium]|nr:two pore domain potassium channel family protein [bacterium]
MNNPDRRKHGETASTIVALLSLVAVVLLEYPVSRYSIAPNLQLWQLLILADTAACAYFWWEYIRGYRNAEDRIMYAQQNFINLLGAIPIVTSLRWLRLVRLLRIFRFLHFGRLLARLLRNWGLMLSSNPIQSLMMATLAIVFLGSTAFYYFEHGSNPGIQGFFDAVWLTVVSSTTVGYGDIYPVTTAGRITGVLIMIVGVGILGSLTAAVSALVLRAPEPVEPDLTEIVERLERIERKLEEMN